MKEKVLQVCRDVNVTAIADIELFRRNGLLADVDANSLITELEDGARATLNEALARELPDAPDENGVAEILTKDIDKSLIWPPGPVRRASGDMKFDRYKLLLELDKYKDKYFTGEATKEEADEKAPKKPRPTAFGDLS
mmetsp:Transcript_27873/g.85526  ORF Transcript_27873/g.85526 Transcript_27873/m.85526 type:complete len:138 (-) Transcript_27873:595-1008(-)